MAQGESQGTGQESVREFRLADFDMRPEIGRASCRERV